MKCRQSHRAIQVRERIKRGACHRYSSEGWAAMHTVQLMQEPSSVGCMKKWCGKHATTLYWTVTFDLHSLNVSLPVLIISSAV